MLLLSSQYTCSGWTFNIVFVTKTPVSHLCLFIRNPEVSLCLLVPCVRMTTPSALNALVLLPAFTYTWDRLISCLYDRTSGVEQKTCEPVTSSISVNVCIRYGPCVLCIHKSLKLVILNEVNGLWKFDQGKKHKGTKVLLIAIADSGYDHMKVVTMVISIHGPIPRQKIMWKEKGI